MLRIVAKDCAFTRARLSNADMREGDFESSTFNEANLYNANLERASLSFCNMTDANLERANINNLRNGPGDHLHRGNANIGGPGGAGAAGDS